MIEILKDGFYIVLTVNGSYVVEHLRTRHDYSHMVKKIVDGPFEDVVKDGETKLSAYRLATVRMAEILAKLSAG